MGNENNIKNEKNPNSLGFLSIFGILKKHLVLIIGFMVVGLLISLVVTFGVMKPKYTSTTELLVNQKLDKSQLMVQAQQTQTDIQRIYTYKDIITSPVIQNTVKNDLENLPGIKKAKVNVSSQQNSQVFSVSATASNPYTAASVANDTANVFQNKVKKMMSINSITVVSKAKPILKPTSPNLTINILIGLILGSLLGVILALIKNYRDVTINDTSFLEDEFGLNNLGIVTEIDNKNMYNNSLSSRENSNRDKFKRRV